ncbi:DUF6328 family protein [Tomitella biformata]|uniref:DUF6328 family protein n=1 Tax=Tomitella biformata TaxID=630403 RepID=UPI000464044D|nr:DUF6328 family protein [Tomitella biformata]
MTSSHAEPHDDWSDRVRDETPAQHLDRNWSSLLQELRVVQTGVQLLTGFLLTLPFQARFAELSDYLRGVYLVTVLSSITATILLVAPISMHRLLFRRRLLARVVHAAHWCTLIGLLYLGVALTGSVILVVTLVVGNSAGNIAGVCTAALFIALWFLFPWRYRR